MQSILLRTKIIKLENTSVMKLIRNTEGCPEKLCFHHFLKTTTVFPGL